MTKRRNQHIGKHSPSRQKPDAPALERDSGFGYIVRLNGREIGHVGGRGRHWSARAAEFSLGEFKTRREAVEAVLDVDRT